MNSRGMQLWKQKIKSSKNILFLVDRIKFIAMTWSSYLHEKYMEMGLVEKEKFAFHDNLDILTFYRQSYHEKKRYKLSPINSWQVERLLHKYMPFVMRGNNEVRLHPSKAQSVGFWYKIEFTGGDVLFSKKNTTMVMENVLDKNLITFYGGQKA